MLLKDNSLKLKLGIFGLFIFPFALLTGPFLPDLIISLEAILFLIICFKNNNWEFIKTPFFKIYITFYLIIVLSSLLSIYPYHSLKASLPHIRFFFFASIIPLLVNSYKNFNVIYFRIIFLVIIFLFIDTCYQYFFGYNIFGIISSQPGIRVSSVFGEELILGSYVMKLFPICLAFLFTIRLDKKKLNFNVFLLFFISLIIILFSGDRVPLLLYAIFTLILFLSFYFIKFKFRFFFLFNIIILSVIVIVFNPKSYDRIITKTNQNLIKESEASKDINILKNFYFYSNVHENYMKISINMFKDKPILGHGPNTFRYLCKDEKFSIIEKDTNLICSTHPHNTYVQLLAEAGIFSMLIFLIVFILTILFLFKIKKKNKRLINIRSKIELIKCQIIMATSMIIIFFPLLPSGNIFNNRVNCFVYFCIGFYIYFKKKKTLRNE